MIKENIRKMLDEIPHAVELEAACKTRSANEILEVIGAGVNIIGENYIQEAEEVFNAIGKKAKWHFIGHLQKNKVKRAVKIFDMIETIDSFELAEALDKANAGIGKIMPVLVEINSGKEDQKFGVLPEKAEEFIMTLCSMRNIKVEGLMTMGPLAGNPENARPYFKETKKVFERVKHKNIPGIDMKYLSMGMSNSYKIAIQEGANIIRIGTKIFGERLQ
jgi:PLP dependent protein